MNAHCPRQRTLLAATLALALALALAVAALATPAQADSRTIDGKQLVLTLNSDVAVTIEPDPALHGSVRLAGDDTSCLRAEGGDTALVMASACGDALGHLTIEVPPGFAITLSQDGSGDVRVGNTDGRLVANLGGSGALTAGRIGMLVLNTTGSGDATVEAASLGATVTMSSSADVRVRSVNGPLATRQSGSGDLTIGAIEGPAAEVANNGSGDTMIGKGNIASMHGRLSGSGDLVVAAIVGTADLEASGGGDIRMAKVTGPEHHSASGDSTITLQSSGLVSAGMGKLASLAADSDDDGGTHIRVRHSHGGVVHFFAGVLVLVVIFYIWRTVRRNRGNGRAAPRTTSTNHPGVMAVRDTLARLDGRLAQVEYYVTSREFDLQKKFRELDAHK